MSPSLSSEQVQRFEADGFLAHIPLLSRAEVTDLRARVEYIREHLEELAPRLYEVEASYSARPEQVVCHFLGGWQVDSALAGLVADPRITQPLAQLLGLSSLRFWHDQVFYKPPGHPGCVPWHQDYSYWSRTGPARHITINILLDDADEESGCLEFIPGSQRWGLLPSLPFDAPLDAMRAHLSPLQLAAFQPQAAPLPAGSATIHHSHTLHGSGPNRSDRPRRALVFNYMAPDTRVLDGGGPLLRGTPQLATGSLVEGAHFPIVLP